MEMLKRKNEVDAALKVANVLHCARDIARVDPGDPLLYAGVFSPAPMVMVPPVGVETVLLLSNVHEINPLDVKHWAEHAWKCSNPSRKT